MNEEEAIEYVQEIINDFKNELTEDDYFEYIATPNDLNAIETVLNLLEKKDIDIIETKEANRQLSIELQKKDKIIKLMEDEINKLLKDGFERIGLDVYLEKENLTVREFIERKVENGN